MPPVYGQQIGPELLEALGLTGRTIVRLSLDVKASEPVTLTIVELVNREQAQAVAHLLSKYNLTPDGTPIHCDRDGNPITNSMGEPYEPLPTR